MQMLLVFLAVFSAAAVAYPKVSDQSDDSAAAYPITSSEYLKMVLGKNPGLVAMSIPLVSEGDVASRLESLGLREMAKIARQVDLDHILAGQDAFTLFAPADEAVRKWKKQVPELAADQDALTRLCMAWMVPSALHSSGIVNEKVAQTMDGAILRFNIYDQTKSVTCNGAAITELDQQLLNGIVHVVDRVIFPLADGDVFQTLDGNAKFSKFIELVKLAELERDLATSYFIASNPLTLFAPINEAFDKLPRGVMAELEADKPKLQQLIRYHVASGTRYSAGLADGQQIETKDDRMIDIGIAEDGNIQLNKDQCITTDQTRVIYSDLPATNGVIHVIDNVLVPQEARYTLEL